MLEAGGLAPVQVLATLHGHFSNMLALDGDDVSNDRDAAAVLGTAPFVAKKALEQSRRLGSTRIAEAINLIAAADLDVRGRERHGRRGRDRDPGGPAGPPDPPGPDGAPAARRRPPLTRSGERRGEPPPVVLGVPDAVLAQAVVLVGRLAVDLGPGRLGAGDSARRRRAR